MTSAKALEFLSTFSRPVVIERDCWEGSGPNFEIHTKSWSELFNHWKFGTRHVCLPPILKFFVAVLWILLLFFFGNTRLTRQRGKNEKVRCSWVFVS
jgi:hypothetical protein